MNWQEDFYDEPSVEERYPSELVDPDGDRRIAEFGNLECETCQHLHPHKELITTDMSEYYTMDLDAGTLLCFDCYEAIRLSFIPEDPFLYDVLTPVAGKY